MFLFYSFLYTIAVLVLFIPQYLKRPEELRRKWVREKFGVFNFEPGTPNSKLIWIHAVSVGEVNASIKLIKKLKSAYPAITVVLSTITDTGQKVALEKAPQGTKVVYLPFDIGFILRRCISRIKPEIFIVIETELWPNIFKAMASKGTPVVILNGRISEKSFKRYKIISFFMKRVFSYVEIFCMQSQTDAGRLKYIGADEKKVSVIGNFKFDMDMPEKIPSWAENLKAPVIVAGSTHKGEEEIIISAFNENLNRFPELKLILAPRHPERFKEVEDILKTSGLLYVKRSELGNQTIPSPLYPEGEGRLLLEDSSHINFNFQVILLDSIGELSALYGVADIAVIGKSFTGIGGQNPLEPAYWGKPVLCGPHMENFPFITDFFHEGAAFEVDATTLAKKIKELLLEPEKAKSAGQKARELYMKNSGAVKMAMKVIGKYVN